MKPKETEQEQSPQTASQNLKNPQHPISPLRNNYINYKKQNSFVLLHNSLLPFHKIAWFWGILFKWRLCRMDSVPVQWVGTRSFLFLAHEFLSRGGFKMAELCPGSITVSPSVLFKNSFYPSSSVCWTPLPFLPVSSVGVCHITALFSLVSCLRTPLPLPGGLRQGPHLLCKTLPLPLAAITSTCRQPASSSSCLSLSEAPLMDKTICSFHSNCLIKERVVWYLIRITFLCFGPLRWHTAELQQTLLVAANPWHREIQTPGPSTGRQFSSLLTWNILICS